MRQACELLWRGASFWIALSLMLCLAMFFLHRFPWLSGVLAIFSLLSCLLIAAALDSGVQVSLGTVLQGLRTHLRVLLGFAVLVSTVGALVWMLLLARPEVPWWNVLYTARNSVDVLSSESLPALRQIFVYSAFALGLSYFGLNLPGLTAFFQFPCMVLLGLPLRDAWRLASAGQMCNLGSMLGIGSLFMVLPVAFGLWLPPLVPVLYCFFGALAYVAFREIFLGRPDNQPSPLHAAAPATPLSSRA